MSNKLPLPTRTKRRKLSVEVYFVLYLTAIILLLGTAPLSKERYDAELEEAIAKLINTDFNVEVEDIGLTVPFIPAGMENDSNGIDLILDTVNVIRAHGSFSRVEFRILAIQDTATGNTLPIEKATLVRNGDSSVFFFWNQGEAKQTAIYRISVEAEAKPIIPSSVSSPALRQRIEEIIARRNAMRDTAIFSVNVLPITSPEYLLAARQTPTLGGNPGDQRNDSFSLFSMQQALARMMGSMGGNASMVAGRPIITSPPNKIWEQQLMIAGVSPEQLTFKYPPGVSLAGTGSNYILIRGTAPPKGEQQLTIRATPQSGGQTIEAYFTVTTTTPSDPRGLPQTLYQGNTYYADFGTAGIDEGRISVTIVENGRTVADNKGASFNYIPASSTGTVRFLRSVDGKPFGEYVCDLEEYPKVTIGKFDRDPDGSVTVTTTNLSTYRGGPNVPVLRIDKGNALDPVKERAVEDKQTGRMITTWRIRPKNASQSFDFTVRAWDLRGREYFTTRDYAEN